MIFIIMFSGCKSNDNNSESISGETDTNVTDTIELKYFPIAIDDAGIVLPRADLSQFGVIDDADQDDIYASMNYRVNYILYGIGLFSEWYSPEEYKIAVSEANIGECVEYPFADGSYKTKEVSISYELTSVDSETPDWFLDITLILQDKENPYLLDDWYEVQTSVRTIYDVGGKYSTDMCPFEIYVESDTFGGNNYFDASLGEWLSDINSNVEESTNMEVNNINVTSNTRSDESLKYDALV